MSNVTANSITLYFCPDCARLGRGSVSVRPSRFPDTLMCLECGWTGPESKAQQHSYPCKIYKTVEMEIPVLVSMWDMFRPEKAPILDPKRTFVSWFIAIENEDEVASATKVWIDQALDFLVTKDFLPVAHYKLIPEHGAIE